MFNIYDGAADSFSYEIETYVATIKIFYDLQLKKVLRASIKHQVAFHFTDFFY